MVEREVDVMSVFGGPMATQINGVDACTAAMVTLGDTDDPLPYWASVNVRLVVPEGMLRSVVNDGEETSLR